MIKYLGFLLLLNNILTEEDYNYRYDYSDDDISSGDDYVYNKTDKARPKRIYVDDTINNVINEGRNVGDNTDNYIFKEGYQDEVNIVDDTIPKYPKKIYKRDCNYTRSEESVRSPEPNMKDDISTYPFVASVLRMGSHYATGVLVDKRWVLSAGGVFYNVRESIKLYRVHLGSVNCKRGGNIMALQQIVIHPSYMPGKPESDLAMLRLSQPADLSPSIHPVSLTERKGRVEISKFLTMYWPRLIVDGKALPADAKERQQHTSMRVSTQRVLPWKQCWRAMSYRLQDLTHNSFCLRPLKQFHTLCLPDVGAPVLSSDGLWGIISGWVGEPCSYKDPSPVVVARISPPAVRHWLESQFELED
ncbi:cationic trypsin-3-like [Cydia amplana]|uniref:cationic trypsin-3-like n=1 Tax=Cydia amplana TaxID=1869771 RepID=UPI002FE570A9